MRATVRPGPPFDAVPGYRWRALPDDGWRMVDGTGKRCRHVENGDRCNARADLEQELSGGTRPGGQWHPVCHRHSLGRWIEGGRVMSWALR